MVRVLGCGPGGREFESLHPPQITSGFSDHFFLYVVKMENIIIELRKENPSFDLIENAIVEVEPIVRVNGIVAAVVNLAMNPGIDESFHEVFEDITPFMLSYTVGDIAVAGYYLITGKKIRDNMEVNELIEHKDEIFKF